MKEILLGKKKGLSSIKIKKKEKVVSPEAGFSKSIYPGRVNIIAEIKKASPSRGIINSKLDVTRTAEVYDKFSDFISGLSILTEELYFLGDAADIGRAKQGTGLPVLRKDFIFNEKQVLESAALGADCILLIKPLLGINKLKRLYGCARKAGLEVLVETYSRKEFLQVLDMGAGLIGINNRNLRKMEVDSEHIISVIRGIPEKRLRNRIIICESGIGDTDYIGKLFKMGVNTFLIGSHFMTSPDLEDSLEGFRESLRQKGHI